MKCVRALLLAVLMLPACRTAHEVAISSYQTASAPVDVVRQPATSVRNPTVAVSDITQPGHSVTPVPSASPSQKKVASQDSAEKKAKPTPAPAAASAPLEFPTAKPVEGKPGYVYSPFDSTKYVDVSGYAPGSKVKDPYSGKIFLVP
jgi:hypothetical protein